MAHPLTLMAVGDIMLGETPPKYKHGVLAMIKKYGPNFPFEKIRSLLKKGDIVFGNLECTLSANSNLPNAKAEWLRVPPNAVEGLKYANFSILSVANNHTMDHGRGAFEETLQCLVRKGIKYCGAKGFIHKPRVVQINGLKIGFLNYCFVNSSFRPIYSLNHTLNIIKDIKAAKKLIECLVVSFHWGNEFMVEPSRQQKIVARTAIDAGADVILGHHPHVLQKIEQYNGKTIAYSLGNFISDLLWTPSKKSVVLELNISQNKRILCKKHHIQINNKFQPEPTGFCKKAKIVDKQSYLRSYKRLEKKYRTKLCIYFIVHFYMYSLKYISFMFKKYLKKR